MGIFLLFLSLAAFGADCSSADGCSGKSAPITQAYYEAKMND